MPHFVALCLLLCSAITMAEDEADANHVNLDVKPLLCIIDRRTPACDMEFLVAWQSTIQGYYCLFSHFAHSPLRCWRQENAGQHEERRIVDKSFQFWLTTDDTDERLAAVTVEVMTTETDDRRRRRRTRHVWDIL